jgi:hypothetical protein
MDIFPACNPSIRGLSLAVGPTPERIKRDEGNIDRAMEGAEKVFRTVALVVIVVAPMRAGYAAPCMTESEARRVYSTSHLYWHGADHCWDATSGRLRGSEKNRHHFVRQHRDEDEAVKAQPRPGPLAQPKPLAQAQPQLVAQTQPQLVAQAQAQLVAPAEPQPLQEPTPPPALTTTDLIRAGNTRIFEKLESKFRDHWSDLHMEFQTKPSLVEAATADAESTVAVGLVILSIGGILVICTMLISFGATVEQRQHGRQIRTL